MRAPCVVGSAINARRYNSWIGRFGSYRSEVNRNTTESWLKQFEKQDRDLAARVLDSVEYFGQSHIAAAFREVLESLPGWNHSESKRSGSWVFSQLSSSGGESGGSMLHQFRVANKLDAKSNDKLFPHLSDVFSRVHLALDDPLHIGENDVVVLLDDFSGTGTQVCDAWNDPATSYGSLLAGVGKVYLLVVAASDTAHRKIKAETSLCLVDSVRLCDEDNVFSNQCKHFSKEDKARLLHYGNIASSASPKGYGECGLLVVFQHRAPNNSIPILHANNKRWTGMFPRHD